ncbi:MMPL family transporter [Nitratireductor sp. CAU 1489]|uniref:MMPL family transporter n=1 Tax=Nitratireductor arenosus TaxID=2682096 RepID=A0A844QGD1_9HYPH|nr:MMPL family transporter [Nitratireductor arenosus]MVA98167.1 MMPL family transporter [Nitratireductor arenosus]
MGKIAGSRTIALLAVSWLVLLLADLAALVGIARLDFDDGLKDAFVSDSAWYADYNRFADRFTQTDGDIVVLFESADFARPRALTGLSDFVLEAGFVDGVASTISILTLRGPPGPDGAADPLVPANLPDPDTLARLLDDIAAGAPGAAALLSPDRRLAAVLVSLADGGRSLQGARTVIVELQNLAAEVARDGELGFSVTGITPLRAAVVDGLYRDIVVLTGIGIVAGFLVCLVALRSLPLALLTTMPSATAMIWTLGVFGAFGFRINIVTVALPVLILVLSFTDSLHLTFEVGRRLHAGRPPHAALADAVRRVGPACALASITTAIAFAGLTFSGSLIIRDLGFAGVIAGMASLLAVLFAHPLLFATAGRFADLAGLFAGNRGTPPALFDWQALPRLALARPLPVAAGGLVLLAAAIAVYPTIEPVHSLRENVAAGNPVIVALDRADVGLAPVNAVDIPVHLAAGTQGGLDADALARVEKAHGAVERAVADGMVLSLASLARQIGDVPAADKAVRLRALLARMDHNQRARFVSGDGEWALVRLHTADNGGRATRDLTARLEGALARADLRIGTEIARPTGFLAMSAFVSAEMITDLNYCFLIAVGASGLLTVLWFRNWRYGLIALVPNLLPIALVGAWLALTGRGLQFASGVALTVAFGIAVDDTVHVLNRLRLNAPAGAPFDPDAIRRSMEEATPILVVTTAVLSFGLIGTFLSTVPTAAYFGALSIVVLVLAVIADLVVLPACLALFHPRRLAMGEGRPA